MWLVARVPFVAVFLVLGLGGCSTGKVHHASSVVEFLYPDAQPVVKPEIPVLQLPIRVGIAFVPDGQTTQERTRGPRRPFSGPAPNLALTERRKTELLQEVVEHFKKYPFVGSIETIPSAYLRPRGGFTNLDQLRSMYSIDVIALLSYDQVQFTDEGVLSLTYWTIVGAYIVPGSKNDTHTMLDAVVYDIASRKLLFRAPGTSHIKGHSTPVNLSEELRTSSDEGFTSASKQMIANLDESLGQFREKVKARPTEFRVISAPSPSSRGGGSFDVWTLLLIAGLGGAFTWLRRSR